MNRMRLAALIFCIMLLVIFFNYMYVYSVRTEMLGRIDLMCEHYDTLQVTEISEQMWKNRKGLLSLSVPLAVLDQVDIQFSLTKACAFTQDQSGYLRACFHLRELISSLGK